MQNQATKLTSNNPHPIPFHANLAKSLGATQQVQGNAVQGGSGDLGTWLEEARAWFDWYQGVTSGRIPLKAGEKAPTQAEYAQASQWYQWAMSQNTVGSWNPTGGIGGAAQPTQSLPPGSKLGPMGNMVFNSEKAETTYTANGMPIDVLSDEFVLNVDVKVKDVHVEKTTDSRLNPAAEIIKITVQDPTSVPSETVYFVQPDAKISINTIGGKGVTQSGTDSLKLKDGTPQISVGTYSGQSAKGTDSAESSLPGVADKMNAGTLIYKPEFEGETVDFRSLPGKNETHVVWANANITARPGDKADVSFAGGELTIKITHDDNTSDTYVIKNGYDQNFLTINKAYVTFNGQPATDGKIPSSFASRLKISGMEAAPPAPAPGPSDKSWGNKIVLERGSKYVYLSDATPNPYSHE